LHSLSQRTAAKKIGISCSTLQKIELGRSVNLHFWIIIKYCTAFEVSPDFLLGYDRVWPGEGVCQRCGEKVSGDAHTIADCMVLLFDRGRTRDFLAQKFDFTLESVDAILKSELAVRGRCSRRSSKAKDT